MSKSLLLLLFTLILPGCGEEHVVPPVNDRNQVSTEVELEGLIGTAVRIGEKLGVSTPVNSAIYALLKPAAIRIEKSRSGT